ncbi:MAG: ATP-dependent RNA/DNA helicase IGHMBP2 [Glaciecola sp.]|jgi:ATP-dependent RNA/DNA helicase IGHMBP2
MRLDVQQELVNTQALLQIEKEADLQQYKKRTAETSFKHRRVTGVCWYPVLLEKSKYDNGERLIVRVSRSKEHVQKDGFQSGKLVSLFCVRKGGGEQMDHVDGVVNQVKEQEMFITLNCDELPLWIHDGILGVQLLFDENAYKEMEYALRQVISGENKRLHALSEIILGSKDASFNSELVEENLSLNKRQNEALQHVLQAEDVAIVHGPPGTGKTTTIIESIKEVLKSESQVLVCAPSNAAVDLLVSKLSNSSISAIRIGHPARVTEEALSFTLDARITVHKDYKTLRQLKKKAEEYFVLSGKWKRNFGREERQQRTLLLAEARKLKKDASKLSSYITSSIIEESQVICSTLVGASNMKLKGLQFDTVFIDEAAQALEPAAWIPILKANRVVFAGDHQQLPPTVKSYEAGKGGLRTTLFEKAIQRNLENVMLNEQYRMNEQIMNFSSKQFYGSDLNANDKVAQWKIFPDDLPVEFIDTAGTGFEEQVDAESRSTFNKEEARLLLNHFQEYMLMMNEETKNKLSIGIITPYRAQVDCITQAIDDAGLSDGLKKQIKVNTVDSFQGQERDVIYISLVRSNDKGEIGFLSDKRRMNVAMTRAKKKLVIIGDSATICRNEFYANLFDYVNGIGAYRSAFELLYS